jgi:integrating conjugative element protein (TIGR03758 family)
MHTALSAGFLAGSGVDPATLKLVLLCICVAVVLLVGAWMVSQLVEAYRGEQVGAAEIAMGTGCAVTVLLLAWLFMTLT